MLEFWRNLLDVSDFPARWYCGNWSAGHGWLHILSDVAIWGAYMVIPLLLTYFLLRRREIPFTPIFWLFAAFIFSCGTTHLLEAGIFWWPAYRLSGVVKLLTALVSWATVLALIPAIPKALALPRLGAVNAQLSAALEATIKSEERFRHVIEAAPNGMVIVDDQGRIVLANSACARIFGYEPGELTGESTDILVPPHQLEAHRSYRDVFLRAPQTRPMGAGQALYGRHKDGSEVPVEIGLNAIESGDDTLVLASIIDITERRRGEAMVAGYTAELERSNRELDEFAYVASHDLRTPLEGIESLATWVQEDSAEHLPEKSKRHLQQIQQRVLRLKTLLDDLLEYSRAGRPDRASQQVDVGALVEDTIAVLAPPAGFRIEVQPDFPVIEAAETPLRHIFQNLIENAIKHHDREDGTIRVGWERDKDFVAFTVSDDGPGIDPAYHGRIFKMFETLRPRDHVEGSGMGLAIIKKLLETYGGSIGVSSSLGAGTEFRFTWPRGPEA